MMTRGHDEAGYAAPDMRMPDLPMASLDRFARHKLAELEARDLRRSLVETARVDGVWVERNGRRLLSFSCNDYLNLAQHPAITSAAIEAIRAHGFGAGASRLVTGNHPLFVELETRLARLKGTEAACVFGSGYLANAGIIPALVGAHDLVLLDELAHSCLWTGARLARSTVLAFRHNDVAHAQALLTQHRAHHPHVLIATETVFSMDGDRAPLAGLAALAGRFDAWLLADDAHGMGVLAGTDAHASGVALQVGTLSKALGSYGAYLAASRPVIELMHNRARTLIYSTGLPPAAVAAAIAALDLIARDPDYAAQPLRKAKAFTQRLGLPEAQSPIVPLVLGEAAAALKAAQLLEEEGFLVVPIRPPTVPEGTARLRFSFSAGHPDAEIERLAAVVGRRILTKS
jgi:8-amino-7-oxononanoate synthase